MYNLIYKTLTEDRRIAQALASHRSTPAVFLQDVPADTDRGWSKQQYPRIVYGLEMQEDPQRHTSGQLAVELYCTRMTAPPEAIAPIVRSLLDGAFFTEQGTTFAVMWNRSDMWSEPRENNMVCGMTCLYDVVEMPSQLTTDPDPAQAINRWTKAQLNEVHVIGVDPLPEVWRPTGNEAAVYWQIASIRPTRADSWAVSWHEAQLVGHILADNYMDRQAMAKILLDQMQQDGEIIMLDDSPMLLNQVTYNASTHPIKQGQLTVTATYGVLRRAQYGPWLHPTTNYVNKGGKK